jgi:hypothetical protein
MNDEQRNFLDTHIDKVTNEPGGSFCTDGILCSSNSEGDNIIMIVLRHVTYVSCCGSTISVHFTAPALSYQKIVYASREQALRVFKDLSMKLTNTYLTH